MKNNIIELINKYWVLILYIIGFCWFILPACFQNNQNLNVVFAEHIDSGSILSSILQLSDTSKPDSYYNQNIPYHTAYYGFPFNSILFWIFSAISILLKISFENAEIFALTAKLFNFIVALGCLISAFNLLNKILKYQISKIIYLTLFCLFTPFLHYTFHIKPDILGLLFSLICFNYLFYYLQNPKLLKNIILANIFGGLAFLCKQPHIFIIFPLFLGFIFTLKENVRQNLQKLIYVYLTSGIIFLFLTFLIHPYIFIQTSLFIARQREMFSMTSASMRDNINSWFAEYLINPLLLLTVVSPFLVLIINFFKKLKDTNSIFISLISTYSISYILWLTLKVGPIRTTAYLIPILPISLFFYSYVFDISLYLFLKQKVFKYKALYLTFLMILIFVYIKAVIFNLLISQKSIQAAYSFKDFITSRATRKLEQTNINFKDSNILYSASLPVNAKLYKKATNDWQTPNEEAVKAFNPDYLFIDFTVYWEKSYEYWKEIAIKNGLDKESIIESDLENKKDIILFYK
ncbi:hypothetical protein GYA19_05405 [Candidatus Beckwithbacteria bacterium]|nr:hypothetical protein [Candidatus Beckwithbacteria bacterium]